ncbi:MAG: hypothetical protein Q8P10_01130 [bacterium]|nr:hypothetical protein [bacterium]
MGNKKYLLFALLLLVIPSVWALFLPGIFESDDGEWMVIRFSAFFQAFADGQFPVRFLGRLNNGFGYPVANFLYPGFMYFGIPIHLAGLNFVNTIKAIFVFSMIGSGIFSYFWLSKLFDKVSSFFGALYFVYAPYHIFDLYKRGSIGELLAIAILPFILWQAERKSLFWTTIGISSLILSHNTLAVLFLAVIVLYFLLEILISKDKRDLIYRHGSELFLGLGLSSFFWVPAVFDLQYTVFSQTKVSDWAKYFSDLNLVGTSTIIIFVTILILFVTKKVKPSKHRLTILLFLIGLISIFFALPISSILWKTLPVSFIQFPFRMLSVVILCSSFLFAFILSLVPFKNKVIIGFLIILLTFLSSKAFLFPKDFSNAPDSIYSTNEATTTVQDEYMPKWVIRKPENHFSEKVKFLGGKGEIQNLIYNSKKISFDQQALIASKVRINTIYYPGWEASLNGNRARIDFSNELGVMDLDLPAGKNKVVFSFKETPLRLAADYISIFSAILLLFYDRKLLFKLLKLKK